jgi:ribonucleoside-triphosphate reductase
LTAVILQLQSNQQYGGIADDNLDFDLAPFVDISFRKNLKEELERYIEYNPDHEEMTNLDEVATASMNWPSALLYTKFPKICVIKAIQKTDDDTHQAMEGLIGNLNSLQSRSGNQVPFSSLNFGLNTSNCGRMISKNLIKSQMEGLGDGLTAIFPILIFKLMKGYTKNPEDPNYDLYLDSIKCLARRFYPNFVRVDSSFNKPYIKYETKEIEGCVTGVINSSKKCGVFVELPSLEMTGLVSIDPDKLVNYKPNTPVKVKFKGFDEEKKFNPFTKQMEHIEPYSIKEGVLRSCNLKPVLEFVD